MRICVVIPAYNEATRITQVLEQLKNFNYDIIVVDDGSVDNTAEMVSCFPVTLLRHSINLGQGAALKTGTDYAIAKGYDQIIHFDADGQHRATDIEKLHDALFNHEVAIGSRFMDDRTKFPVSKRIIYKFATIFSRKILSLNFTDPQCGFRALRLTSARKLDWQKTDFEHCSEILGLILKHNLSFVEIPIIVNYDEYSQSKPTRPSLTLGLKLIINKLLD